MLGRIVEAIRGPKPAAASRPANRQAARSPRASYDAARPPADNANHFRGADGLGPNASVSPDVREKLRRFSRYERDNNCYFGGLIEDRAAMTIGTGPRLQLTLPDAWVDPDFQTTMQANPAQKPNPARVVEQKWSEWAAATGLVDSLTLADETETTDGEVFVVAISNPVVARRIDPVNGIAPTLDVRLYEADQCGNPYASWADPKFQDGIEFDDYGNPKAYYFLKSHPGEIRWQVGYFDPVRIEADRVFHFFKKRRPAAAHGIPGLTAAIPLGSRMRRMTDATLAAAEIQALIAAVLKNTNANPPGDESDPGPEAMDTISFSRAQLLTLYAGQDVETLTPSQPGPSYREFKAEILTECGRAIGASRNVSTGSSAEYNYSSGRLDMQGYQRTIVIRRKRIQRIILDRLFRLWLAEAVLIPGYLPEGIPPASLWSWTWRWDGFVSIDPLKDANAAKTRMESGLTTMERECGEVGEDWEEVIEQQSREREKCIAEGLPDPYAAKSGTAPAQPVPNAGEEVPANAAT